MLVGLVVGVLLVLLIGAVVLRAAVAWYNHMAGGRGGAAQEPAYAGYSANVSSGPDSANPFASPTAYGGPAVQKAVGVPEPGVGRAMGIVFVTMLAQIPVSVVVRLITGAAPDAALPLGLLSWPASFLISAAVLKGLLPTPRFGTACLIALLELVVWILILLVIGVIVFLVAGVGFYGLMGR
jgi:hypothetical protein